MSAADVKSKNKCIYIIYQCIERDKDDWTDPEVIHTSLDEKKAITAANKYHTEIISSNRSVITEIRKTELDSYVPNLWEDNNSEVYILKYNKPEVKNIKDVDRFVD